MNLQDVRLLLVEDDAVVRTFVQGALQKIGIQQLAVCQDGQSALAKMASFRPDIILTDIHMKPMDGAELVRQVRQLPDPALKRARVIVMTADSSPGTLRGIMSLGVDSYIVKPPRINDLKQRIESALGI